MGVRPHPLAPLVSLSTSASWLRVPTFCRVAREAGADGIDLDLSGRPLPDPERVATVAERHGIPIRSVWVPPPSIWTAWRSERALAAAVSVVRLTGAGCLVFPAPIGGDGSVSRSAVAGLSETALGLCPPRTRVVVALQHRHLEGGRRHLAQMTALRRLAEEWELGIALDLSGAVDARWEAEAAVSRLGARLMLIRLAADAAWGTSGGGSRVAIRALAAAIDGGHPVQFAVVPGLPFWQSGHAPALGRAYSSARRRIAERHAMVDEQRVFDAFPPRWQEHRG